MIKILIKSAVLQPRSLWEAYRLVEFFETRKDRLHFFKLDMDIKLSKMFAKHLYKND